MTPTALANLFRAERRRFARYFPEVRGAQLFLGARPRGAPARAFAFVEKAPLDPARVTFYREALTLPRAHVLGLIRLMSWGTRSIRASGSARARRAPMRLPMSSPATP